VKPVIIYVIIFSTISHTGKKAQSETWFRNIHKILNAILLDMKIEHKHLIRPIFHNQLLCKYSVELTFLQSSTPKNRTFVMFMWNRHYINSCYSKYISMADCLHLTQSMLIGQIVTIHGRVLPQLWHHSLEQSIFRHCFWFMEIEKGEGMPQL